MQYWLNLFSPKTWQEFLDAGGSVSGFRLSRIKTAKQIKPGDRLLCYLTGISRFVGVLEAISAGFEDETPIWSDELFPARLKVKVIVALQPDTAVPIHTLIKR